MQFNKAMRKETVTKNEDGSYTVKGGGWFWVRLSASGQSVLETPQGMMAKKASRLFIDQAKLTIEKHFPQ